jgi:hypothetical protein
MTVRYVRKRIRTTITEHLCDGPRHKTEDDAHMEFCVPITVSHGYGSPFDNERHEFCSVKCLQDWARNPFSTDED